MGRGTLRELGLVGAWAGFAVALLATALPAGAAVYTWTGAAGADTNWSNGSNWGGSGPTNGEADVGLIFPPLAGHYASHNDLTGLQVTALTVTTQLSDGNYAFTGNAVMLNGPVTLASPGTGNPNLVWQIPLTLGGDVTISASGRQTQWQGPINLGNSTLTLDAGGDIVLAGVVSGSGNLIKSNGSALTITGTNTYTGSTTSNRGALYIAAAAALGATGAGTTFNGGFLGFVPGSAFTTAEPFVFNGGGILAYGTPHMAGQVTLNTTISVQAFNTAAVLTIGGTIVGTGGLDKTGPGLLVLNAPTALYAGATAVKAGTLQLDTALASTNPVTVESGATLQGNGSSGGAISVHAGAMLAPGDSPGSLSSSGLSMVGGAILAAEIDGPSQATEYDTLAASGPVSLGGATLAVTLGYAPLDGEEFTLIAQQQGQPVTGTFDALPEGATFQVGSTTFGITYAGGSGHDVVLVAGTPHTPTQTPSPPTPTATMAPSATATGTPTIPTQGPTATHTSSQTPSPGAPTATLTPTPTATEAPPCTGDCDGHGTVAVNELVIGVNIALDNATVSSCPQFDPDGDGHVVIAELIEAVGNALTGCPVVVAETP